ncbi:MFS transporter [Nocardia implantans]|uniref:MFS transporter n=1 Tax=Nocardia implantans TaxID=3108168 RepID=A0ABU6B4U3_9NOCA|nr:MULTISPECIES: MFS transporter [unclassified Nocardia]MBF6193258.1 MFS transporter [Nocardia beijingensis]MEA3531604.1 MFS transporter [Nocardia sp. CDC192]MEB3514597.1 MFS transporter [Nocardia sp. CDC186]
MAMLTLQSAAPVRTRTRVVSPRAHTGRTVPFFVLAALLATGQMYVPIPLFTAMQADWHVGPGVMTWIISAFAFGYAGGFVLFGPLSDRYGHRRVLVTGMLVAAVVTLLTGLAVSAPLAVGLRVAQGLVVGSIPPAIMAYVATRVAPAHRSVATMSVATSFLAATVIAQIVSQWMIGAFPWRTVFVASAIGFAVLAVVVRTALLADAPTDLDKPLRHSYAAIPAVLRIRALVPMLIAGAMSMAVMVGVYTGLELTGVVRGSGELLALRAGALPVMVALPLLAVPLARLSKHGQIVLGALVAAAAMVIATFEGTHPAVLAVLLAVLVGGLGVIAPAVLQSAGELGGESRAAAMSVAMFSFYVGATIGPLVAATAAPHGFAALAWTLALLLVAALGMTLVGLRMQRRAQAA